MELNNLKTESAKLRLTPEEKTAMRASIFGVVSPMAPQPSSYFAFSFQFLHTRVMVPALALVLVFGGASTTAAAQGALPGDFLYPVKISVNEAIKVALATTPVAKAEVSAELAVRRVEEAEVLASRGQLTPEAGEKLAANFEVHADTAATLATELEGQDPDAATDLRTKLDSSLLAHGEILAMLTVGGGAANQEGAGVVAARVLSRTIASALPARAPVALMRSAKTAPAQEQVMTMSMSLSVASDTATSAEAAGAVSLEGDMTVEDSPADEEQEQAATRLQKRALEQVATTRAKFNKTKYELADSAITQVSGELASIDTLMDLASTTFATGHYIEAQDDYTEALRRATKLYVLLGAQANFKQNVITPILEKSLEGESSYEVHTLPAAN